MNGTRSGALLCGALDYLLNCAWQAPLLALAAVALTAATRATLRVRCVAFAGALVLVGLAPLVPIHPMSALALAKSGGTAFANPSSASLTPGTPAPIGSFVAEGLVVAAGLAVVVAAIRLAAGWMAARGLARRSTPVRLPAAASAAMRDFLARSGRPAPQVRACAGLAGPAVVGAWAPVVLIPPGFEALPQEQLIAALLHECAHVARRDYAWNLLCETVALPSSWHPAAALLRRRFRSAREAACDHLAATALGSPARYARCLVELARTVEGGARLSGPALQLLGRGELEDRVRRLTGPATGAVRLSPLHTAGAVALALGSIAPLACLHLTPVLRDSGAPREVARVTVFDHTARATPPLIPVAPPAVTPPSSPRRLAATRPAALVRLRRRVSVQLAQASRPPSPVSVAPGEPAAATAAVTPASSVTPPAVALARLDETGDIGRLVFALEIRTLSPCLAPPRPDAGGAVVPPPRAAADPGAASDFDPFAPPASAPQAPAPLASDAPPAPAAAAAPTCFKAAALQPARRPGMV